MVDARDGLQRLLNESGLKRSFVAKAANITPQALSDITGKRRKMDANLLFTFCVILEKKPNDFYENENSGASPQQGA
ncbi:helix-turn-helix transcriptional regulator [Clostridia bacterium OttesenSCG-928-O13]|nr:helix-turn-helix transcriptional regulator [Clostridia bacterium OttesenSCG-928-O13]